jgi:multidrug efflux pump subunit AcrA (membrane-fusion protein)
MKLALSILLALAVPAGSRLFAEEAPEPPKKDLIILDEAGVKNLRLETVEAIEADFEQSVLALGHIEVFPGRRHVISSRIPGRALKVNVKPDQVVKPGDELVVLESRQPGDPPPSVAINAPIAGVVAELQVTPGKPVSPEDSLMSIVDLGVVHALAKVPEHFAGRIAVGQKAHIRVPGYPGKTFEATLEHLGALADAETGTLEAAFHVENPGSMLRPGMRAEFSIVTSSRAGVMAVPRAAVQGEGASRFVYIADYELENAFEKVPVELGEQNDSMVEIVNGLFPGDSVVTRGAYALGFAGNGSTSLKEALDAAHGHAHAEDGSELGGHEEGEEHDHGHHDDHDDHDHEATGGPGFNTLTVFFAGLSGLLLVLLVLSLAFRKSPAA